MSAPVITFLSDYGHDDDFVGVCHGVIASICPEARVIDITHGLRRHDVLAGAIVLRNALPYMPVGVHLAVVDPDVGAERRAVALLTADGRFLVGPDNGLLSLAAPSGGGIVEAADIGSSPFRLAPISATFHGRDIFAPVAAHLAAGASLADAGTPLDPAQLVEIALPRPGRDGDALLAHVIYVDRFGNVELDVRHDDLAGTGLRLGLRVALDLGRDALARTLTAPFARTFADVGPGELLVYEDGYRT
ncbi:MAG: SAM-dependent chlorinase/fluorinase, partial [Actinomycetota bacterium]|nr:SAM-dependent chlorinase/fluorinase [Actinomycetota bacterium]